jgi:hypothetical protein
VSEPSLSFDDSDPGGYVYTYAQNFKFYGGTLTQEAIDKVGGYSPCMNGFFMWLYVFVYEAAPLDDLDILNCTLTTYIFRDGDFTGLVGGERVCDVGSCCDNVIGRVKYSDDVADYEAYFNDRVTGRNAKLQLKICIVFGSAVIFIKTVSSIILT